MDSNILTQLAEQAPIPTILFLIFLIYHRSESKKWQHVLRGQERNNERIFDLLQQEIQVISNLSRALERIDTKVTMGWSCPLLQRKPEDLRKAMQDINHG